MDIQWAVRIFFYIVVVAAIFGILWFLAGYLGGLLGPPVGPYLQAVVIVLGALVLIGFLLHLLGINVLKRNDGPPPPA